MEERCTLLIVRVAQNFCDRSHGIGAELRDENKANIDGTLATIKRGQILFFARVKQGCCCLLESYRISEIINTEYEICRA